MYYTYAYLRKKDRTPYYIGKGQKRRMYAEHWRGNGSFTPKDKDRIIILKYFIDEIDSYNHEMYMIAVLGRKDLGTGVLHNKTNGGEGASGAIRSLEFKENLRRINKNKILSKEHKEKLREANIGKNNPNYGKSTSKETKEKMRESRRGEKHPKSNWWKLTFSNKNSLVLCGLSIWASENEYNVGNIYSVYKGTRKRHKDIIMVEKLN